LWIQSILEQLKQQDEHSKAYQQQLNDRIQQEDNNRLLKSLELAFCTRKDLFESTRDYTNNWSILTSDDLHSVCSILGICHHHREDELKKLRKTILVKLQKSDPYLCKDNLHSLLNAVKAAINYIQSGRATETWTADEKWMKDGGRR
jgi:hypothetical protein